MNTVDALLHCIDAQSALLDDFIQALRAEGELLLESPSDEALGGLTQRKNDFARRLSDLDQTRAQALGTLGFEDSRPGIEAACAAHPGLQPAFDALWDRVDRAKALNQDNGLVLHAFMAQNQRALDALRSLMGEDLYDARGRRPHR